MAGALTPSVFRLYNVPVDGLTKNYYFRAMLTKAREKGFSPDYVIFDSWY